MAKKIAHSHWYATRSKAKGASFAVWNADHNINWIATWSAVRNSVWNDVRGIILIDDYVAKITVRSACRNAAWDTIANIY